MLMHYVRMGLIRHLERDLGATGCDVNFSQFRVLKALAHSDGMNATELARRVEHDAGALTRMLDRLQEKGYVIRRPCEGDRRAVDVTLTEAGRVLWSSMNRVASELNAYAVSDLTEEEQKTLTGFLQRIRATVER
ncbi:MarR family winged helix-turn-helix transcriptional regulator [Uliginosibacterium sp. sgz301328]|uniref:MarR family winged helix-turn-helix transcriptional regulator n=1 Tax=Uliginosibacterium sp. sgz301328 TaxID=3243764 RepID=UPI00359DC3F5